MKFRYALTLAALVATPAVFAVDNAVDKLIELKRMCVEGKSQWFKKKKKHFAGKMDLKEAQMREWEKLGEPFMRELSQSTGDNNNVFDRKLKAAVELSQKHMQQWKDFCDQERQTAEALYNRQKSMLDQFASRVGYGTQSTAANMNSDDTVTTLDVLEIE